MTLNFSEIWNYAKDYPVSKYTIGVYDNVNTELESLAYSELVLIIYKFSQFHNIHRVIVSEIILEEITIEIELPEFVKTLFETTANYKEANFGDVQFLTILESYKEYTDPVIIGQKEKSFNQTYLNKILDRLYSYIDIQKTKDTYYIYTEQVGTNDPKFKARVKIHEIRRKGKLDESLVLQVDKVISDAGNTGVKPKELLEYELKNISLKKENRDEAKVFRGRRLFIYTEWGGSSVVFKAKVRVIETRKTELGIHHLLEVNEVISDEGGCGFKKGKIFPVYKKHGFRLFSLEPDFQP